MSTIQTILIVEKHAEIKDHLPVNEWTAFLSTATGILKSSTNASSPSAGLFLLDLRKASHTLADLIRSAVQCNLSYRFLTIEDPDWIEWKRDS